MDTHTYEQSNFLHRSRIDCSDDMTIMIMNEAVKIVFIACDGEALAGFSNFITRAHPHKRMKRWEIKKIGLMTGQLCCSTVPGFANGKQ